MPRGRPSPKLAISVDPDVHQGIVAAAQGEGLSVSAWMTQAARDALRVREGLRGVQEYEAEQGAFTDAERDEARRAVDEERALSRPAAGDLTVISR